MWRAVKSEGANEPRPHLETWASSESPRAFKQLLISAAGGSEGKVRMWVLSGCYSCVSNRHERNVFHFQGGFRNDMLWVWPSFTFWQELFSSYGFFFHVLDRFRLVQTSSMRCIRERRYSFTVARGRWRFLKEHKSVTDCISFLLNVMYPSSEKQQHANSVPKMIRWVWTCSFQILWLIKDKYFNFTDHKKHLLLWTRSLKT